METEFLTRIRTIIAAGLLCLTLTGCGSKKEEQQPEEYLAAAAAKEYLEAIYSGHYDDYLDGRAGAASMPSSYRDELLTAYRSHANRVERLRQGVSSIDVIRTQADTATSTMLVFLAVTFGDSSREEVVVPMVNSDGEWRMR